MIPSNFVQMSEIPLTSNGKIDKKSLPEPTAPDVELVESEIPESEEEKLIAGIWKELLHLGEFSRSANFFELGGHSLAAIQVMLLIEKSTGIRLPYSDLFEYPTVMGLAKRLHFPKSERKYKSLVALKPEGSKPPLYIVHGAGLGVFTFDTLTPHLSPDQPVYGLQAVGIDGLDEPLKSVEEMAAYYISEILEHNPDGPFLLAGYSTGAIIALEMSLQLEAMKKNVSVLVNFDFAAEDKVSHPPPLKTKLKEMFLTFLPRQWHMIRSFIRYPKQTFDHQSTVWKLRLSGLMAKLGVTGKEQDSAGMDFLFYAMDIHRQALVNYELKTYNVKMDVLSTKIKVNYMLKPVNMGWDPFVKNGLKTYEIPGDHDTMIQHPNSIVAAGILQKIIDKRTA
jgi:thioesterase domain-containing protein/acyl carrier protein